MTSFTKPGDKSEQTSGWTFGESWLQTWRLVHPWLLCLGSN